MPPEPSTHAFLWRTTVSHPIALITGGSTGIGRAIAGRLASDGFRVIITGRNEESLRESASQHESISYVVADVTKAEDIRNTMVAVKERHGRLDVLVNNAGVAPVAPIDHIDAAHVEFVFGVNVRGLIDTTLAALPFLRESKGSIINISSVVSDRPVPNMTVYSASKAAVSCLSKGWAKELAPDGVRVNVVSPGPIETPIFGKMNLPQAEQDEMGAQISAMVPLGRFGTPDEIAGGVAYLASSAASYVNGADLSIDGGLRA